MQKIKNIEFLRIFLIITIVLYHMRVYVNKLGGDFFQNMYNMMDGGRQGVEAFFIIAGFFLILTFRNIPILDFVKKKYFRLMPAAMFSIIICGISSLFKIGSFKFIPSILMGLLVSHFGIYWCRGANITLWYVSSLFFGFIVFYLIIKFVKEQYQIPIFLILGIGSYALLSFHDHGMYSAHSAIYYGCISPCTLRAFGGMGIGVIIAKYYLKYKEKFLNLNTNILKLIFFSLIEIITLGFVIWWSYFKLIKPDNSIYVIAFAILFICFLLKQGILSKLTDWDKWADYSKYAYSLFCVHLPIIRIVFKTMLLPNKTLALAHPVLTVLFTLLISVIAGIITYYLIEKPCFNWLMNGALERKGNHA